MTKTVLKESLLEAGQDVGRFLKWSALILLVVSLAYLMLYLSMVKDKGWQFYPTVMTPVVAFFLMLSGRSIERKNRMKINFVLVLFYILILCFMWGKSAKV